ncbi:MAG TPA: hypothetical protein VGQ59_11840 [Cyclobacteriaceae bacterium]|nr:hypothetical protein [Cyclobacteriaceae bacterium]
MHNWDISFLNRAVQLLQAKTVHVGDVPEELQQDLKTFLFGKTVQKDEEGIVVFKSDYQAWISKLNSKGIDYEIQLRESV